MKSVLHPIFNTLTELVTLKNRKQSPKPFYVYFLTTSMLTTVSSQLHKATLQPTPIKHLTNTGKGAESRKTTSD